MVFIIIDFVLDIIIYAHIFAVMLSRHNIRNESRERLSERNYTKYVISVCNIVRTFIINYSIQLHFTTAFFFMMKFNVLCCYIFVDILADDVYLYEWLIFARTNIAQFCSSNLGSLIGWLKVDFKGIQTFNMKTKYFLHQNIFL